MDDTPEDKENLNRNLMEGMEGSDINNINEVPNSGINTSSDNNVVYGNQPLIQDKLISHINPDDTIKVEYEKAIFSDFEKIIQYDSSTNTFKPGLDNYLSYPYHFNPTLLNLTRYRIKCDCCGTIKSWCLNLICENPIVKKILFFVDLIMDIKNIFSILATLDVIVFINAIIVFFRYPSFMTFLLVLIFYAVILFFESRLLYYSLPPPITKDDLRKKIQAKIQSGQRIFFGDDKKVVPLVYHSYKDISGTLELTKTFNIIKFVGRPGTYFLDGKSIREFNKINEEFGLRGGNQRYYINYEDSPRTLNRDINYETQSLNSMFSAHEINELYVQDDEVLYLAPQGFEKWNKIALICFFCLVGQIYNNYFELNLDVKSYKIRKAIFFEEPEQEIEEKLQKYSPKVIVSGELMEFEEHSGKIDQNSFKPYFDKWDEYYNNEKNNKEFI